jgi:hypothetical protein
MKWIVLVGIATLIALGLFFLAQPKRITWSRLAASISINGKLSKESKLYRTLEGSYLVELHGPKGLDYLSFGHGPYIGACDHAFGQAGDDLVSEYGIPCPFLEDGDNPRVSVQENTNGFSFVFSSTKVEITRLSN